MCHVIITFRRHELIILILLLFVNATSVKSINSTSQRYHIFINMPVVTRSQTKSGLQKNNTSAPLPSYRPTCSNAISTSSNATVLGFTSKDLIKLPDLINQSNNTPSSSEQDSYSASSNDSEFEISNFENSEILFSTSFLPSSISNSSQFSPMESDCKEDHASGSSPTISTSNDEILKVLTALSSQMVVGHQDLQKQLLSSNNFLKAELHKVKEENEKFRLEMRAEMHNSTSSSVPSVPSNTPTIVNPPVLTTSMSSMGSPPTPTSSDDFQTQMLTVLNDTFAKLSSVISNTSTVLQDTKTAISESKSSDSKTEWSKFTGDPKKFRAWYLAVMAQLSIAPWQSLYDASTNSVVTSTSNVVLNGKLYAKVIG